jgi:hypothetical protein
MWRQVWRNLGCKATPQHTLLYVQYIPEIRMIIIIEKCMSGSFSGVVEENKHNHIVCKTRPA